MRLSRKRSRWSAPPPALELQSGSRHSLADFAVCSDTDLGQGRCRATVCPLTAVEEGEVRAVIGPNGAGKSTLFNLITGALKPTHGSVRFAGEILTGLSVPHICQRGIARTFQLTARFPQMSARENVRLAAQAREARRWRFVGGGVTFRGRGASG